MPELKTTRPYGRLLRALTFFSALSSVFSRSTKSPPATASQNPTPDTHELDMTSVAVLPNDAAQIPAAIQAIISSPSPQKRFTEALDPYHLAEDRVRDLIQGEFAYVKADGTYVRDGEQHTKALGNITQTIMEAAKHSPLVRKFIYAFLTRQDPPPQIIVFEDNPSHSVTLPNGDIMPMPQGNPLAFSWSKQPPSFYGILIKHENTASISDPITKLIHELIHAGEFNVTGHRFPPAEFTPENLLFPSYISMNPQFPALVARCNKQLDIMLEAAQRTSPTAAQLAIRENIIRYQGPQREKTLWGTDEASTNVVNFFKRHVGKKVSLDENIPLEAYLKELFGSPITVHDVTGNAAILAHHDPIKAFLLAEEQIRNTLQIETPPNRYYTEFLAYRLSETAPKILSIYCKPLIQFVNRTMDAVLQQRSGGHLR